MVERPLVISSPNSARFGAAMALRHGRDRRERSQVLIDGAREISQAIRSGVRVTEAWVARERLRTEAARAAFEAAAAAGAAVVEATPELLARLAYGDRDEGIVCVGATPDVSLGRLRLPAEPLVVVLEGVEKPGNLGAVARTADGAGADALIVADPAGDPWNPNAIRASLGTVFSLPLAVCPAEEALGFIRGRGLQILAARVDGSVPYTEADLRGPVAIVLGSESEGLGDLWRGPDITAVRIPMAGFADSLNVSVSAAVLLYEARRQRG